MKNVSRNKLLLCFRPGVDMEVVLEPGGIGDRSAGQVLRYSSVDNKERMKATLTPKRNFSRVIKAVMFETLLAKRVRDGTGRQDSCRPKRSRSVNSARSHVLCDDKSINRASVDSCIDRDITTSSRLSHSLSFDSPSSSGSISKTKNLSRTLTDITRQDYSINHQGLQEKPKDLDMGCSSFNTAIHLLVLSLIITILWGRLYAIVFTSIWAYFLPRRHMSYGGEDSVIKLAKTESRESRKKVIMEGLLERNHHSRH